MKKLFAIILVTLMLFSLTGCNEEQKEALQSVIDQEILSEESYTPDSYQNYLTALENAKEIKDGVFSSKKDIDEAQSNLQTAIDELYIKPDKTELISKRDNAQQMSLDSYLPNSRTELDNAIQNASSVIDDENARKENIDDALSDIENGIKALVTKPNKNNLSSLIKKAKGTNKNRYTTASCNTLESVVSSCESIVNNENSTQQEVNQAEEKMEDAISDLVVAKNGVYRINCSLNMTANLSVGNEWLKSIEYNGKSINNGQTITVPINSGITIKGTVIESDSVPDVGSGSVYLSSNGGEKTIEIYVRENRGRYSGNFAIWELTCSAELIERV